MDYRAIYTIIMKIDKSEEEQKSFVHNFICVHFFDRIFGHLIV